MELAVVVGRRATLGHGDEALPSWRIRPAQRLLRARLPDRAQGQWVKGKSWDTFAPLGPFLATSDEVGESAARVWLTVNGNGQNSSTAQMIFGVPYLVTMSASS